MPDYDSHPVATFLLTSSANTIVIITINLSRDTKLSLAVTFCTDLRWVKTLNLHLVLYAECRHSPPSLHVQPDMCEHTFVY